MRAALDTKPLEKTARAMERIIAHRKADPTRLKSEIMYFELSLEHLRAMMTAREEGKTLAGITVLGPCEICYAMDIIPYYIDVFSGYTSQFLGLSEDYFAASKSLGLSSEICSVHRLMAAYFMLGHAPLTDVIILTSGVCDHTAMSGDISTYFHGCPSFFVDRPYHSDEHSARYLKGELERLIHGLEDLTGRKMDYDRLREVMAFRQREIELYREINELRKAVPCPTLNGTSLNMAALGYYLSGTQKMVDYLEAIRDEARENVQKGKGAYAEENYRLMWLMVPPAYSGAVEWMGKKRGAVEVINPYFDDWGDKLEIDPRKPLDSLVTITMNRNVLRPMEGPLADTTVVDVVRDAKDYQIDGAIYFAHCGCRIADGCIRILKDTLMKETGIPMTIVDFDVFDTTYVTGKEIINKLECFFELLDDRK